MEIYQQKNNIREKADNFIEELKNALSEAEDKDREGIVQKYYEKALASKYSYLCYVFAKDFQDYLNKFQTRKLGNIVLKSGDIPLNYEFSRNVWLADKDEHLLLLLESGNDLYINAFMEFVEGANVGMYLEYVAETKRACDNIEAIRKYYYSNEDISANVRAVAKRGSVYENFEVILMLESAMTIENQKMIARRGDVNDNIAIIQCNPYDLKMHAKVVAKKGTPEACHDFILSAIDEYQEFLIEEDIEPCIRKILASKNIQCIFNIAISLEPQNLEEYAKIIVESKDLLFNFLAYENWPDKSEEALQGFKKVVQSYPRKEVEQIGMFKLELDHKTMHGVASKYYDNQVNKNNDGDENE